MTDEIAKIAIFGQKKIRRIIHKNEWWFSVTDIIEALTETPRPRKYWSDLKKKVGFERIQEIEDPELAQKRVRALYKAKGYPDEWIERRMRGIAIREELTDQWQKHGVEKPKEYEILTAEISKATFGVIPGEYKKLKGLKRENLRDHMKTWNYYFLNLAKLQPLRLQKQNILKVLRKIGMFLNVAERLLAMQEKSWKLKQDGKLLVN